MAKRFSVIISGDAEQALQEISARKGKSKADVLRDAIGLLKWIEDSKNDGAHFLIERDGQSREIVTR